MRKIALIGGDSRQIHAAEALQEAGFLPYVYGNDGAARAGFTAPYTMEETLLGAQAVVLPVPSVKKEGFLFAPHTERTIPLAVLETALPKDATVFLWDRKKWTPSTKGRVFDLKEDEILCLDNARTTAEAALTLALRESGLRFCDMHAAVVGYGRIARELSRLLLALGASVTVIARRKESRDAAEKTGAHALSLEKQALFSDADVIFNTVPAPILTEKSFADLRCGVPYIELASVSGIAPQAMQKLRCRVVQASGLPGKFCPRSAGRHLAQAVLRRLEVTK